jgi:hypothetical protein
MIRPDIHEMSPDIEEDVTQLMVVFAQNYEALFLSSVTILSLSHQISNIQTFSSFVNSF